MDSVLVDPLDSTATAVRYCTACDNNSATYGGKFLKVPRNPEVRLQWLVRVGIIEPTDPFPETKIFYVCDHHFDKQNDFTTDRRFGIRLRAGILPWRNLKTGTYSYHGYEVQTPPPCQCSCCKRNGLAVTLNQRLATVQTDDVESRIVEKESIHIMFFESQCRLCVRDISTKANNLMPLFCHKTRKPASSDLMEEIYVTVGLLFTYKNDSEACICNSCLRHVQKAYRFRLQTRTNNRAFLATQAILQQNTRMQNFQLKRSVAEIEQVVVEALEADPPTPETVVDVKKVKLEQEEESQDIKEERVESDEWLEKYVEERLESDEMLDSSSIVMEVYVKDEF